ncbi:hypothetical protein CF326_g7660, partial [Tilletia indica]
MTPSLLHLVKPNYQTIMTTAPTSSAVIEQLRRVLLWDARGISDMPLIDFPNSLAVSTTSAASVDSSLITEQLRRVLSWEQRGFSDMPMIPLPTERTGPAEEEGDHCEDDGISKESLLRGDLSQELDGETLRWLPYLHSPLTGSVNLCWNESGQQVLEAVRADTAQRLHGGEVPHLDRALLQHQALINEIATMREDNWSPEPVFHWGQLGYEGKNPAGR